MEMTKELYDKCRNPLKQAFCALDAETQAALNEATVDGNVEHLHARSGLWEGDMLCDLGNGRVYRISDKAAPPPEPQWVDVPVEVCRLGPFPFYRYYRSASVSWEQLSLAVNYCDFDGIEYDTGFVKSKPYDPSYGTPVSVRFRK